MWISLADVADTFLVIAWTDLEKKRQKDPSGLSAFIVERAFKGFSSGTLTQKWGILAGNTGFFKMDGVEVPEENLVGTAGRGVQDRDVRARSGPSHRGGRRDRIDSRVPRRQRQIRARKKDLWRRDRPAPAGEGNDRADGVRLSGVAPALAAVGVAQERRAAQYAERRGWPSGLRRLRPSARRRMPCRFTARTDTPTSIPSAGTTATPRAR